MYQNFDIKFTILNLLGLEITHMSIWFNRKILLQTNQFYLIILQYKVAKAQFLTNFIFDVYTNKKKKLPQLLDASNSQPKKLYMLLVI